MTAWGRTPPAAPVCVCGSILFVFDDHVGVVLDPTVKSCGWSVTMGAVSFRLHTPGGIRFEPLGEAWAVPLDQAAALRETARIASKWLRKEWQPDFDRQWPFGIDRHVTVRRAGTHITIHIPGAPAPNTATTSLAFGYLELPRLRAAFERIAAGPRKRLVTTQPEGDPHGQDLRPDR